MVEVGEILHFVFISPFFLCSFFLDQLAGSVGRRLGDIDTCHSTLGLQRWLLLLLSGSYLLFCFDFHCYVTLSASLVSEESIEDVEGPNETAGDAEEPAKEQESGGDKDQSKWTGGFWSLFFFKSRKGKREEQQPAKLFP